MDKVRKFGIVMIPVALAVCGVVFVPSDDVTVKVLVGWEALMGMGAGYALANVLASRK